MRCRVYSGLERTLDEVRHTATDGRGRLGGAQGDDRRPTPGPRRSRAEFVQGVCEAEISLFYLPAIPIFSFSRV